MTFMRIAYMEGKALLEWAERIMGEELGIASVDYSFMILFLLGLIQMRR